MKQPDSNGGKRILKTITPTRHTEIVGKEIYMVELDQIKYELPDAKANLMEVGDSL